MNQLIIEPSFFSSKITLEDDRVYTSEELTQIINKNCLQLFGTTIDFYLLHNGKIYDESNYLSGPVVVVPRVRGGKGGFGSMLRAIGAQIEKTTNREACRDLSGRRLRDINEEKRLKKWIAEQAEREQEALKRKKKKLEKLTEMVRHEFVDEDYTKARVEMTDKVHESVEEGFKAACSSTTNVKDGTNESGGSNSKDEPSSSDGKKEGLSKKREKNVTKQKKKIKGNLWVDDLEELNDDSETSEEETPKKKAKTS